MAGTPGETIRSRAGESARAAAVASLPATVAETTEVARMPWAEASSASMEASWLSKR